jgi:outer membrane protein OmpA-like peptidoglycan-associated protein
MTRIILKAAVAVLAVLIAVGCATTPPAPPAPKSYVVLLDNPDGTVGEVAVSGTRGNVRLTEARSAADLNEGAGRPYAVDEARINRDFGQAMAARPPLPVSFLLYYRAGGTVLTPESEALLPKILEEAARRPAPDVSVIGHTDTVGGSEANEKLGLQRARSVAEIIRKAGLKVHDLTIASHGEGNPLVATPDNTSEPKNRRVEITIR